VTVHTGSRQSAATSEIVKRFWSGLRSLTHISSDIASTRTLSFTF